MSIEGHLDRWDIDPSLTRKELNKQVDKALRYPILNETEYKIRRAMKKIKEALTKTQVTS